MKVAVLGCGRWGSFLGWYARRQGHQTVLWGREGSPNLEALRRGGNAFLALPPDIALTHELEEALCGAELVLISLHAQGLRGFLKTLAPLAPKNAAYVLCMKGLEAGTGLRLTQVFGEGMGPLPVGAWLGPGHVQSFLAGIPNCMVADSRDQGLTQLLVEALGSDLIRFYYGDDLIGNEIGAATKNVVGLAAGLLDGLELTALKGALMARAPREVARLIAARGGNEQSAYGLAHLGDYEATLFSPYSNNRRCGEMWARGERFPGVAEGVPALAAVMELAAQHDLDMPICACLSGIFFGGEDPMAALNQLFGRSLKREFW